MGKYIIESKFGGLGDNLFHSPIPRLIKEQKENSTVYLSLNSKCNSYDTYKLVWQNNPYIDGLTYSSPNFFDMKNQSKGKKHAIDTLLDKYNLKYLPFQTKPEIYNLENITVKNLNNHLLNRTLIDFNYISFIGAVNRQSIDKAIENSLKYDPVLVNPKSWIKKKWNFLDSVMTSSLSEYTNLISRSKRIICVPSGPATLAVALNIPAIVYYGHGQNKLFLHSQNENIQLTYPSGINNLVALFFKIKNQLRLKFNKQKNLIDLGINI